MISYLAALGVRLIFGSCMRPGPRPMAVSEWLRSRCLYMDAAITHESYGPDTSTSDFLLLPPGIRLRDLDELIPSARCAHEDMRIDVSIDSVQPLDKARGMEDATHSTYFVNLSSFTKSHDLASCN